MAWQGIEGHDEQVTAFRQALAKGRLAHAYLFAGPPGIGKRLFARALAKSLFCESRPEADLDPCGECPACRQSDAATHPDLIAVARPPDKTDLPIELIRDQVIRGLSFKPDRGRYKVAIVDDADDMNQYTANCLLKTLEEPPARSLLVLVCTQPVRQLATILSRCQLIRFRPLPRALVADLLARSGIAADRSQAEFLAEAGGGSFDRARGLADPAVLSFRNELCQTLADDRHSNVRLGARLVELAEAAGSASVDKRTRAQLLMSLAIEFLRTALRTAAGADPTAAWSADERQRIEQFAARHTTDQILQLIDRTMAADYQIERLASLPLVLEAWAAAVR
jgi:DNA polymerase-3 subunit delta'